MKTTVIKRFPKIILPLLLVLALLSGCSQRESISIDVENMKLVQLDPPKDGQEVAVITTTMGVIKVALYREYAPNTVDNFVKLAGEGYYNNQSVFGVETDKAFFAGSPKEDGSEAKTVTGSSIKNEYSDNLWTFSGAMCSVSGKEGEGDSRYFLIGNIPLDDATLKEMLTTTAPQKLTDAFSKLGGAPNLSRMYTVFGQTFEGLDVIEAISKVAIDEKTKIPTEKVTIEKVEITTYSAH